jgi:hypothetical protein
MKKKAAINQRDTKKELRHRGEKNPIRATQ